MASDDASLVAQEITKKAASKESPYGPFRNDPAQGIPKHTTSPFDPGANSNAEKKDECAGNRCKFLEGTVLVKLNSEEKLAKQSTGKTKLSADAVRQNIAKKVKAKKIKPVFTNARPPARGKMLVSPYGKMAPEPDLTLWHQIELTDKKADIRKIVEDLKQEPGVAWAEPVYERKLNVIPGPSTDPKYSDQWHLDAVNAPAAWSWLETNDYEPGGSRDVVIAVIDTGVDYNHEDLAANMWVNPGEIPDNGVDDDANGFVDDIHGVHLVSTLTSGDPQDDHGHGTHVAGIIAAQADNGVGGVGIAYNTQVMAIKAAQYSGVLSTTDIAEAIYYAVEKGADVINMSFGGYGRSLVEEDALATAYSTSVLVAAAGNDATVNAPCPFGINFYPAAYNWVLGVMAHQEFPDAEGDFLSSFSNYDCISLDNQEYELMAPGSDVWSTLPNNSYAAWSGTSMAAPVVSGIAALLRSKWTVLDGYSSRFIMGQVATTGPMVQAYTPANLPSVSYHVPDVVSGLTDVPQPNLSYLERWLFDTADIDPGNDDDGIVDAGETADLAITIQNKWGKADQVSVLLEPIAEGLSTPDPYVTMLIDTVDYGAIGSFNKDDNGLTYDQEGLVTGVEFPFRFSVDGTTPNDHIIPFRMTITARNGLDSGDETIFSSQSYFFLSVQHGVTLPSIISSDMTLTSEKYWIVPGPTLVETGVTLTVIEGTKIQFWSNNSNIDYHDENSPYLLINGSLNITGSIDNPVELFPSQLYSGYKVEIISSESGYVDIKYSKISNPMIGKLNSESSAEVDNIDHTLFTQQNVCIYEFSWSGQVECNYPLIFAWNISKSIFRNLSGNGQSLHLKIDSGESIIFDNTSVNRGRWDANTAGPQVALNDLNNSVFLGASISPTLGYYPSILLGSGYLATTPPLEQDKKFYNNAILNNWHDDSQWTQFKSSPLWGPEWTAYIDNNYWGTTSIGLIDQATTDYSDGLFTQNKIQFQPILTSPPASTYPFVVNINLSNGTQSNLEQVGAEVITYSISFNRNMDTATQPKVSFGPAEPYTDYPISGEWVSATTWEGTYSVSPITGDGFQYMRVSGAVAADDAWLVTGNDKARFRFEIITSSASALNLQATGGEGYIDLTWTQDDFELLQGFNMYRATAIDGSYSRVNTVLIPSTQLSYHDTTVIPGQPYFYKFTVMADGGESDFSNIATATPTDTVPPVITHTPVTTANPGQNLTLSATATDNVAVQSVTLYYRASGGSTFTSIAMVNTTGGSYFATIEGSNIVSPGIEYYIAAFDGVSTVTSGRADTPLPVIIDDKPVVTGISPAAGSSAGGDVVTISGSNFQNGASVALGGASCSPVTFINTNSLTCTTPTHFPGVVDLKVTNPDAQWGLRAGTYTYVSDQAALGLPYVNGGQNQIVYIPVNLADIAGMVAADVTIQFDSSVLDPQGATTGTLTPGWSIVTNTGTPGEVRLSMASTGGSVTGAGSLATIEFLVIGAPGSTTLLHPSVTSLNSGAIPVLASDGSFNTHPVYTVSGMVNYWADVAASVPTTNLTLDGDKLFTTQTDGAGAFNIGGIEAGNYTLSPDKADDAVGITAFDASKALEHSAGLTTLTGYAFTAADVNASGNVDSMDAFYILQKSVDLITLPFPGAGQLWYFDPISRDLTGLVSDTTNQDFTGILLGDVSGNWSTIMDAIIANDFSASVTMNIAGGTRMLNITGSPVTIEIEGSHSAPDGSADARIMVDPSAGYYQSLDLEFNYNPANMSLTGVSVGPAASGWLFQHNETVPGTVLISMASDQTVDIIENMIKLSFNLVNPDSPTPLNLVAGAVDELSTPSGSGLVGGLSTPWCTGLTVDLQDRNIDLSIICQADEWIHVNGNVDVLSIGGQLQLRAPKVHIGPSFRVEQGATFSVQ